MSTFFVKVNRGGNAYLHTVDFMRRVWNRRAGCGIPGKEESWPRESAPPMLPEVCSVGSWAFLIARCFFVSLCWRLQGTLSGSLCGSQVLKHVQAILFALIISARDIALRVFLRALLRQQVWCGWGTVCLMRQTLTGELRKLLHLPS